MGALATPYGNIVAVRPRLFVPLWHPPEESYAGGFYRAKRLLEQMDAFSFEVTDTDTSDLRAEAIAGRLTRIPARRLYATGPFFKPMRALNWSWTLVATLALGIVRCRACDAVYVPTSEIVPLSVAAFVLSRLFAIPLVLCNNNVKTEAWRLNRWIHDRSALVITLSRSLRDELAASGIRSRIEITGVGVDDRAVPRAPLLYDAIYVARHTVQKGALDLVEIWARCCAKRAGLKLAMVGPCSPVMERPIRALLARYGLERNVDLLGPVPEAEKWRLYASSRVCAFPSRVEGWGIVPVEAHLMRLPVVAYRLRAYDETIAQSPAAALCDVGDYDAFAAALLNFLTHVEGGDAARAWALRFSWPRVVRRERDLLAEMLG